MTPPRPAPTGRPIPAQGIALGVLGLAPLVFTRTPQHLRILDMLNRFWQPLSLVRIATILVLYGLSGGSRAAMAQPAPVISPERAKAIEESRARLDAIETNRLDWIKVSGSVALAELNSKCDLLAIGTVEKSLKREGNFMVIEVTLDSIVASKTNNAPLGVTSTRPSLSAVSIWCELPRSGHGPRESVILYRGGQYLLWLNAAKTHLPSTMPDSQLLPKSQVADETPVATKFVITRGSHGAYIFNQVESLHGGRYEMGNPFPWQDQFLNDLVKTNDVFQLKRIVVDMARALKNDQTSHLLLESMSKRASDPVLAGIAKDHLDKGVTNIFNYVNPGPIP